MLEPSRRLDRIHFGCGCWVAPPVGATPAHQAAKSSHPSCTPAWAQEYMSVRGELWVGWKRGRGRCLRRVPWGMAAVAILSLCGVPAQSMPIHARMPKHADYELDSFRVVNNAVCEVGCGCCQGIFCCRVCCGTAERPICACVVQLTPIHWTDPSCVLHLAGVRLLLAAWWVRERSMLSMTAF